MNPLEMIDEGETVLDKDIDADTSFVQHDNVLYFESPDDDPRYIVYSMDLSTESTPIINTVSPRKLPWRSCYTSISMKHDYLFIIGGYNYFTASHEGVNIYDITDQSWFKYQSGPYPNTERKFFSCASIDQEIFAIGGQVENLNALASIETLDISSGISNIDSYSWQYMENSLPVEKGLAGTRCIVYDTNIIIFGGYVGSSYRNQDIFIIDTIKRSVYKAGSLNQPAFLASIILRYPTILVLGGDYVLNEYHLAYQYHTLKLGD